MIKAEEQGYIVVQKDGGTGGEPLFAVTSNALLGRWEDAAIGRAELLQRGAVETGDLFSDSDDLDIR